MRDYGKMFLGLVFAGIILIVVGLMLARAQPRLDHTGLTQPPLHELLRKASTVPPVPGLTKVDHAEYAN